MFIKLNAFICFENKGYSKIYHNMSPSKTIPTSHYVQDKVKTNRKRILQSVYPKKIYYKY